MRILCLHGHGTSSAIFETQLTKVREELGASFEYIYLDGPVESERVRGELFRPPQAIAILLAPPPTLARRPPMGPFLRRNADRLHG